MPNVIYQLQVKINRFFTVLRLTKYKQIYTNKNTSKIIYTLVYKLFYLEKSF